MNHRRVMGWLALAAISLAPAAVAAADEKLPESEVLVRALTDEMARAMTLQVGDLEKPYFIQFDVDDSVNYSMSASHGAITGSDRSRSRRFRCEVRVGSYELDNTNFSEGGGRSFFGGGGRRGGGGGSILPLEDDYLAIRQAIWEAVDGDYKQAVETLTRKRAYMKGKTIEDRPHDYTPAEPAEHLGPAAELKFDAAQWEKHLKQLSASFKKFEQVQDSSVRLLVGCGNTYVVNSEGARVRVPDSKALLMVSAQAQASDGMRLSANRSYAGISPGDFPPVEQILKDIDEMAAELAAALGAPVLDRYSGPVLFDGTSAAQLFQALLAEGVAARPEPMGEQRRGPWEREGLDKKLGTLILPKTFEAWDDPGVDKFDGQVLLGSYAYDDEGVPAARVDLITEGKLKNMCLSRTPIEKLSGSNGHGRRGGGGSAVRASVGCLFIKDREGLAEDQLKAALIEAAQDQGLEYGIRIKSLTSTSGLDGGDQIRQLMRMMSGRRGGGREGASIGAPVVAYKVYVKDGHEEPFRGAEFGPIRIQELKRIAAAGSKQHVYNYLSIGMGGASPPASIIAPAVLFSELELAADTEEHDNPPILKAPAQRQPADEPAERPAKKAAEKAAEKPSEKQD